MIIKFPNEKLESVSGEVVGNLTLDEVSKLCERMRKECWEVGGFGISAVQIGEPFRIFGIYSQAVRDLVFFIDPEIFHLAGPSIENEGCLSIPGYEWKVERFYEVGLNYFDLNFNLMSDKFVGIEARVIQHEMDHLDGILLVDSLSSDDFDIFVSYFLGKKPVGEYDPPLIKMT